MSDTAEPAKPAGCPICAKPAEPGFAPFCSARCKQIDLGRWLGETYVIPGEELPETPDDGENDGE